MAFEKWEALGNDFVIVRRCDLPDVLDTDALDFKTLCDRRRGIGADGVLIVSQVDPAQPAFVRMDVHNADGSRSENCGNGIRCVARHVATSLEPSPGSTDVEVLTGAGAVRCQVNNESVRVAMGSARLRNHNIPPGSAGTRPAGVAVQFRGANRSGHAVSMGNPHLILFSEQTNDFEAVTADEARRLEHHRDFPERANVSFADVVTRNHIPLVVWERGVGFTHACGTAACAVSAAAVGLGLADADHPIAVDLPGGRLLIEATLDLSQIVMTGPARLVYSGQITLAKSSLGA